MPPFNYGSGYVNPYVQSISSLLQQPGQIEAQRAMTVGNAQAQAAQASGQAYGNAIQGAGQAISGAIQQATDPRRQMELMAFRAAQEKARGNAVIDKAMQGYQPVGPQPEGEGPAPVQHAYLDDQGLADPKKIKDLLAANGLAHLAPELLQGVEAQNNAILAFNSHKEEAGKKQAILLGSVANTTMALMKTGMPFETAAAHASSSLIATGAADPATIQQQIAQLAQLPPEQRDAQLLQLKKTASQLGPKHTVGKDAIETDMFDETTASNIVPDRAHPVEKATFGLKMPDGTIQNVEGMFDPNANAGKGAYLYQGKDVSERTVKSEPVSPTAQAKSYRVFGVGDVPLEFVPGRTGDQPGSYFLNKPDGSRKQLYPGKDFVDVPTASQEPKPKVDITPEIQTSVIGGLRYVDASRYGKDELARARTSAEQAGIPIVSKEVADGVSAADRAALSLDTMWSQLSPYLPKDASGRVLSGPRNTIDKVFQTNPVLGAFGSWRTAAIQAIQALAEKGMGLRLNQVEVKQMLESLPLATDDAPTAEQKLRVIGSQLQNKVKVALTADRSTLAVSGGIIAPNTKTPAPTAGGWTINNK